MSNNPQFNTYYHPDNVNIPVVQPDNAPKKQPRRWLRRVVVCLLVLFLIAVLALGWLGWKFFSNSSKVFGGTTFSNAVQTFKPTTLKGEGSRNTNILITGNSVDDPGHPAADLTDSIMILSIDTKANSTALISIPRDLYINIPGYGFHKINEAYHIGQINGFAEPGYPSGGIGLLQKTITQNTSVPLDYYVLVNYSAIRNIVNAIGGVDIEIKSTDPRGLFDPNIQAADGGPLKLSNGLQHLDGQTALNFARARGDPAPDGRISYGFARSDFDRAEHQRQLMDAIQKKIFSTSVMLNPFKVGKIFDALGDNIQTDMKINEARKIANRFRKTKNQLNSQGLTNAAGNYLRSYTTPSGQSALIPTAGISNYSDIRIFLQKLTGQD